MQNKLQELTDKLYAEGLSKGKAEGEKILENARAEAAATVARAEKEAADILARAEKEAAELRTKVTGDLKMAAQQSVAATRQDIEKLIVASVCEKEVKPAMESADFIRSLICEVAKAFGPEAKDLAAVLPAALQAELEPFVRNELGAIVGKGVEASFSKKVSGGFTIGPKDGGYFISFTEETFNELIGEYLRPATRKILFG